MYVCMYVCMYVRTFGRSFINKTNSKGPKIDPWGTPDVLEESCVSATVLCNCQ